MHCNRDMNQHDKSKHALYDWKNLHSYRLQQSNPESPPIKKLSQTIIIRPIIIYLQKILKTVMVHQSPSQRPTGYVTYNNALIRGTIPKAYTAYLI